MTKEFDFNGNKIKVKEPRTGQLIEMGKSLNILLEAAGEVEGGADGVDGQAVNSASLAHFRMMASVLDILAEGLNPNPFAQAFGDYQSVQQMYDEAPASVLLKCFKCYSPVHDWINDTLREMSDVVNLIKTQVIITANKMGPAKGPETAGKDAAESNT